MDKNEAPQQPPQFEEYADYRKAKHERWQTPDEIIGEAVRRATGAELKDKERLLVGESNEVYFAMTKVGQEVVVRINHGKESKYGKENWAFRESAQKGVPVPEMLLIESLDIEGGPLHICVETKMPGLELDRIPDILSPDSLPLLERLLERTGDVISKFHSVKTKGFGRLDSEGNGKYATVQEFVASELEGQKEEILGLYRGGESERAAIVESFEIVEREAAAYPHIEPHLLHGDISPGHVLIDHDEVSGVIDFEGACGGDPLLDLALWDFKHGKKYPLKFVEKGYGNKEIFGADFERRLNFWKLFRAIISLRYSLREGKVKAADRALKALEKGVEYFK